jgi:hypothetical protein
MSRLRIFASMLVLLGFARPAHATQEWDTPVVRIAMGPALHLNHQPSPKVFYAAEVSAGITSGKGMFIFNAELGYAYDAVGTHAFMLTPGFGVGTSILGVTYQPRLLVGRGGGTVLVGMRNSLVGRFGVDLVSLELGHQFAHWGEAAPGLHHDVRVLLGLNPAAFVGIFMAAFKGLSK